jgi:Mn2+/Fe2+ NRAMP family transporter
MATAAIGPGFITQTTVFTGKLFTSFGFAILISILIDMVVQLNIWRATAVSGVPAPEMVNESLPGMGHLLTILIAAGGLIFNIANMGGCGLAVFTLFGLPFKYGAAFSLLIAVGIFMVKEFGRALDAFAKFSGIIMILLMVFVVYQSMPPVGKMIQHSFLPEQMDLVVIITLVGGTVGGYISFAGAQRMLDSGTKGMERLHDVHRGAITGILIAGLMRILLFAAVAGVVATGAVLPGENPAAFVFEWSSGKWGRIIFGIILWGASITSVVASAYTSVSFLSTFSAVIIKHKRIFIIVFMLISTLIFILLGNPTKLLVMAGTINGFVLPVALACVLWAIYKSNKMKALLQPGWLFFSGWIIVVVLFFSGIALFFKDS